MSNTHTAMVEQSEKKELKAGWKNQVDVPVYKAKDIAQHKSKKDMWITIHGKVYDVSEYARDHPGGSDVLLEVAGSDATTAYEDVGHSHDADDIMKGLLVGVLEGHKEHKDSDTTIIPKSASEVVIRRHTSSKPATDKTAPDGKKRQIELAVLACAAGAMLYMVNKGHAFEKYVGIFRGASVPSLGGFLQGFLTATILFGGGAIFATNSLGKLLSPSKSFTSYSPHIQSHTVKSKWTPKGVLDPSNYHDFKLRSKTELSDGIYRFIFDLPTKYSILGLPIGQHVAVRAEIDEHTVVRSYTPISNNRDLGRLELLIRVYPKGAIGNYLKDLPIGATAQIRGPKGAMKYRRGMSKHLGMVGGGTGITPLYQLIRAICEDPKDDTTISLVYGNRSECDIMLREKLEHFAKVASHKFKLYFTLDHPSDSWTGGKGHVDEALLKAKMPSVSSDTKILLCGPPGMVNAVKSSLVDLGFEAPGAVSKMSDQIFCF